MPFLISGTPTFSKTECFALKRGLPRDPKFQAIPSRFQEHNGIVKGNLVAQSMEFSKEVLSRRGARFTR